MSRSEKRRGQTEAALPAALQAAFPPPSDRSGRRPNRSPSACAKRIEASGTVPSRTTLHRALWRWCRQPEYLTCDRRGPAADQPDGTDAGPVAPEHQAAAAAWLELRCAKAGRCQ